MSAYMGNSLKLSYDMLFQNAVYENETDDATTEEPELLSPAEVEELLQKRDEQWETRMENECATARKSGIEEGFTAGKAEAEEAMNERFASIREMMNGMDQEFNQALEELKPHMAALVFEIIEKVLDIPFQHAELQERIQDEITKFVEILDEELHVKVTVSEKDFEAIGQTLNEHKGVEHFTLRPDESCKPGEYRIETKKESIIKNFKKIVADFKETISFGEVGGVELK